MNELKKYRNSKNKSTISINLQCDSETLTEPIDVANKFNDYFSNIAENIRKDLPDATKDFRDYLQNKRSNRSIYFYPTCPYEVGSEVRKSKLKDSTGIDTSTPQGTNEAIFQVLRITIL